jgi:AcrR family transcriptional regulator
VTVTSSADSAPEAGADTREQIFLAAERLFAERGFDGVSVRDIVAEARCNLAAINYHFGTKSELLLEIFRRRARELNKERQRLLRAAAAQGAPSLRDILRALLAPPILWRDPASGHAIASRFMARAMSEATPQLRQLLETDVSHQKPFIAALKSALPGRGDADLSWALHFAGGLAHQCTDANFKRVRVLSGGACDTENLPAVLDRALRFALGGIAALDAALSETSERI